MIEADGSYQLMPPLSTAEFAALKLSIAEHGIQVPVELDEHGNVLDGHHRLQARGERIAEGIAVGDYPSLIRVGLSEDEKRRHVLLLNLARRHLSVDARTAIVRELRADGLTLQQIADAAGVGYGTVHRALEGEPSTYPDGQVEGAVGRDGKVRPLRYARRSAVAKTEQEVRRAMAALAGLSSDEIPDGLSSVSELVGALKNAQRQQHAEDIAAEPPPLPTGPFRVIVADPPWRYGARPDDPTHRARNPYPDMATDDICALPVSDLAADDSVLWLWTTNAHMVEAFDVLDAWGFEQKTILTWVKDRMGTGSWLRGQTEHCLLAVRGAPTVLLTNQTTVVHGPLREHSRKPDEFYRLVETLCPGSKVELFSRQAREGWVSHGNEVTA